MHPRAARPDGGEIVTDAAALLHRQGRFLQTLEDPGHIVRNRSHDETVEQRDLTSGACTGEDPAGGQIAEIGERGIELLRPGFLIFLDLGESARDALPALLDRAIDRLAICGLQAVLHVPNLLGNRGD